MKRLSRRHVFSGFCSDVAPSQQPVDKLKSAHNIRFTYNGEEGTDLLITTEKGTTEQVSNDDTLINIPGTLLGYASVLNYIVCFTHETDGTDSIILLSHINDNQWIKDTLFSGNLNFNVNNPIQAVPYYQSDQNVKIYWVDGINQPRLINILEPDNDRVKSYTSTSFDFIKTMALTDTIRVYKLPDTVSSFTSGVIQYAISYFDARGQESNISLISPLLPISFNDRGGSVNEVCGNAFKIVVSNPDTNFEYLRIYSIFRSSLDGEPSCRKVSDLKITLRAVTRVYFTGDIWYSYSIVGVLNLQYASSTSNSYQTVSTSRTFFTRSNYPYLVLKGKQHISESTYKDIYITFYNSSSTYIHIIWTGSYACIKGNGLLICSSSTMTINKTTAGDDISFIDDGSGGENIGSTDILFVGGEQISAQTVAISNNILLLGGIHVTRQDLTDLASDIRSGVTISNNEELIYYPLQRNSSSYLWGNSLNARAAASYDAYSVNPAGFKYGEYYRVGIQFQHKTGKWSSPIYIQDYKISYARPDYDVDNSWCKVQKPGIKATITASLSKKLIALGYLRARPLICFPSLSQRSCILQGVMTTTVSSVAGTSNHLPDVQASWFARMTPAKAITTEDQVNTTMMECGAHIQNTPGWFLYSGRDRGAEIQVCPEYFSGKMFTDSDLSITSTSPKTIINEDINTNIYESLDKTQTIDSPSQLGSVFYVNENIYTIYTPEVEFDTSLYSFDLTCSDIIIVGYAKIDSNSGNISITTSTGSYTGEASGVFTTSLTATGQWADRKLVSGLFYRDFIYQVQDDESHKLYKKPVHQVSFLVYPWHRSGSLNNDSPSSTGYRYGCLDTKLISNFSFAKQRQMGLTKSITKGDPTAANIIVVPSHDEIVSYNIAGLNYYPNFDALITAPTPYTFFFYVDSSGSSTGSTSLSTDFYGIDLWALWKIYDEKVIAYSMESCLMRYKSAPHIVAKASSTGNLTTAADDTYPSLQIVEAQRSIDTDELFGGTTDAVINNCKFFPVGEAVSLSSSSAVSIYYDEGDSWFQRYDVLRIYPWANTDPNQINDILSVMIESRINIDGRYDIHRGWLGTSGISSTEYNLVNLVYSQLDNYFTYCINDMQISSASYPCLIMWVGGKEIENDSDIDNWTNLTLANSILLNGCFGPITWIGVVNENLLILQDDALSLLQVNNLSLRASTSNTSSVGLPVQLSNSEDVSGATVLFTNIGCQDMRSMTITGSGLYFFDAKRNEFYLYSNGTITRLLSSCKVRSWLNDQSLGNLIKRHYEYSSESAIAEVPQSGILTFADIINHDVYLVSNTEALCYSEPLNCFEAIYSYGGINGMISLDHETYIFGYDNTIDTSSLTSEPDLCLVSIRTNSDNCGVILNKTFQSDITFVLNDESADEKIFSNISFQGDLYYSPEDTKPATNKIWQQIRCWNNYQDTGLCDLTYSDFSKALIKKKFRIWRITIPRDALPEGKKYNRIRDNWAYFYAVWNNSEINNYVDDEGEESFSPTNVIISEINNIYYK